MNSKEVVGDEAGVETEMDVVGVVGNAGLWV